MAKIIPANGSETQLQDRLLDYSRDLAGIALGVKGSPYFRPPESAPSNGGALCCDLAFSLLLLLGWRKNEPIAQP